MCACGDCVGGVVVVDVVENAVDIVVESECVVDVDDDDASGSVVVVVFLLTIFLFHFSSKYFRK